MREPPASQTSYQDDVVGCLLGIALGVIKFAIGAVLFLGFIYLIIRAVKWAWETPIGEMLRQVGL